MIPESTPAMLVGCARWLRRRAENVAVVLLAVMFLAFIIQIVFRYVLNFPIGWTSELSSITWIWLVLFNGSFRISDSQSLYAIRTTYIGESVYSRFVSRF